jgi:DNA-binding transcriptional LysR family regulator
MDLNEILVFTRVVQTGGFSAAARNLNLPKSTVSRRIAALEERIGARLLQRTTRRLGLTDAGRLFFEHSARIVSEIEEAEQTVHRMQSSPRGLLRVTAPLSFASLEPVVSEYLKLYPEVQLDLVCTDRAVDLVEEGFDVAIRAGKLSDSSLMTRSLGSGRRILVASGDYLRKYRQPKTPADLPRHACLTFGGPAHGLWLLQSGEKRVEIRVASRLFVNELGIILHAAREGMGIAWVPDFACKDDLKTRRLRRVLPEWYSADIPVQALYPTARHLSPKVARFIEVARRRIHLSG